VVFAAHFSLPVISFFGTHYQLFGLQMAPPFFLYMFLYLWRWERRDLLAAGLLFLAGSLCAVYMAVMGGVLALALGAPLVARGLWLNRPRLPWLMARARDAALVLLPLGAAAYLLLLAPYFQMHDRPPQAPEQYETFAARIHSIVTDPSIYSYWYAPPGYMEGDREFACFPGWLLLVCALLGMGSLLMARRPEEPGEHTPATPLRALWHYGMWLFLLSLVLSWGTFFQLDDIKIPSLFLALVDVVPGLDSVRSPGRFCFFFGIGLGLLAVAALRQLTSWDRRGVVTWLALGVLVLESVPSFPTYPFEIRHADFYKKAARHIKPNEPVLVLPASHKAPKRTFRMRLDQLLGSTLHWGRIVVGYGSGQTEDYDRLLSMDREFASGKMPFEMLFPLAAQRDIRKFIIFPGDYPADVRAKPERFLVKQLHGKVVLRTGEGLMVEFIPSSK